MIAPRFSTHHRIATFLASALVALAVAVGRSNTASAQTLTVLHAFVPDGTNGSVAQGPLVQGNDCNLFGTTADGGTNYAGSLFSISPTGSFANVCFFPGGTNAGPTGWLFQGGDGALYGTAEGYGYGTVFRIGPGGSPTTLCTFPISTAFSPGPWGPLAQVGSNIYGTASTGGNGAGSVFQVSTNGGCEDLYDFCVAVPPDSPCPDGIYPYGGVARGADGNFYGTLSIGPSLGPNDSGGGNVFRVSPSGDLTNLHFFTGYDTNGVLIDTDGNTPMAGLVQGSDGNFYGVTSSGGDTNLDWLGNNNGYGTVFKISSNGTFTTLHRFTGDDGAFPGDYTQGLIQGSDGNFYGVTYQGGNTNENPPYGLGTIFRISPSGDFACLYKFSESYPDITPTSLIQGNDGSFYGTGLNFGRSGSVIFKFTVPLNLPPNQINAIQVAGSNVVITLPTIMGEGYQLQYRDSMTAGDWSDVASASVSNSSGGPLALTDFGAAANTQRFYRVEVSACVGE